jgi:hypothetical protein
VAVFHLVPRSGITGANADSVAIYRHLFNLALQGKIEGSAVTAQIRGVGEKTFFTGRYYKHATEAASAAARLSLKIAQSQEEDDGEDEEDSSSSWHSEIPRTRF